MYLQIATYMYESTSVIFVLTTFGNDHTDFMWNLIEFYSVAFCFESTCT